jgi:hypothetical protein
VGGRAIRAGTEPIRRCQALQAGSGNLDEKIDALSRADDADAVATLAQHM